MERPAKVETPFVPARLSYDVLLAYLGLGSLTVVTAIVEVPVFVQMSVATLLLLYIGTHLALHAKHHSEEEQEHVGAKDASMFPLMGGAMLVSLYLVFKFLPKVYVDMVVGAYFFVVGFIGLSATLKNILFIAFPHGLFDRFEAASVVFDVPKVLRWFWKKEEKVKHDDSAVQNDPDDNRITITLLDVPCYFLSAVIAVFYLKTRHWILNNIFGMSFSVQGISLLNLDTFVTGAILLVGLFLYDIFFVFATDVMVTVATKFDAPIKLLFPRALDRPSLLGLGDIVIPGIFISLMLRLDHTLYCNTPSFKKPYFWSCMVGYFVGLSMTLYVMYAFNHAQPALLYLVPTCLLSVMITAVVRGELRMLLKFKDHPVGEEQHRHAE